MVTVVSHLSVRMPKWRLRMMRVVLFMLAPFIRNREAGARVVDALSKWVCRGLKVYAGSRRID